MPARGGMDALWSGAAWGHGWPARRPRPARSGARGVAMRWRAWMLAEFRHGWREAGRAVPRGKIKREGERHHEFVLGRGRLRRRRSEGRAEPARAWMPERPTGVPGGGAGDNGAAGHGWPEPPTAKRRRARGGVWCCVTLCGSRRAGYAGKREPGTRRAARMTCERPSLAPDYQSGTIFGKPKKLRNVFGWC